MAADKQTGDGGAPGEGLDTQDVPPSEGLPAAGMTAEASPDAAAPRDTLDGQQIPSVSAAVAVPDVARPDIVPEIVTTAPQSLADEPEAAPDLVALAPAPASERLDEARPNDRPPPPAPEPSPVSPASTSSSELPPPPAEEAGCWRSAIADALAEPTLPEPMSPEPEQPTLLDPGPLPEALLPPQTEETAPIAPVEPPFAPARTSIDLLPPRRTPQTEPPEPVPVLRVEPLVRTPQGGTTETAPSPLLETPPATESSEAFTAAVQDLFSPPEGVRDPHMITLGRRLDPSLTIPRLAPPVGASPDLAPPARPVAVPYDEPGFAPTRPTWKTATWTERLAIAGRYAAYAACGYLALILMLLVLFRFLDPPGSMLMLTKVLTGNPVARTWAPLENISPHLVRAVIVSEDGRFCEHSGIDTKAIKEAIERASGGLPRGASTISMQLTKNLFLWNAKSYLRKVIEIPITLLMEIVWPKRRILEVYLNIAEWGPGIFGAEAAARHHFGKPASRLNEREAALLAAVLPNPVVRNAGSPGTLTSRKARVVQARVKAYGAIASCVVGPAASRPTQGSKAPAAGSAATPAARSQPARKPPPRKPPRREPIEDWSPSVRMGPQ